MWPIWWPGSRSRSDSGGTLRSLLQCRRRPVGFAITALGLGAAVLCALLVVGMPTSREARGPLGEGGRGSLCVPFRQVTIGVDDFADSTKSPITIHSFSLVDPRHVKLLGVTLVPIISSHGWLLIGAVKDYPPPADKIPTDARWAQRRTLPVTLRPEKANSSWNLVFGLHLVGSGRGRVARYAVHYSVRGRKYLWQNHISEVLSPGGCPM